MKIKSILALFALLAIFVSGSLVSAAEVFTIAADSSSGTYNKALGEIINVCGSDEFTIVPAKDVSGGAIGNLDALFNNKAMGAFLHSDVFTANSMADPSYNSLKTLISLWPEPIHVLALKVSKTKKLGRFEFGVQDFASLSDMKNFKIGAAGGGVISARLLQGQGQGGFMVNAYNSGDDLMKALDGGEIAAAIFVGTAPLPNLEKLDKNTYKLLPIGGEIVDRLKSVYKPTNINYVGLSNGPVATLAPWATIMTRKYSTESKISAQRHFRECFFSKLGELQDNASRNWQQVSATDQGVLNNWYEIPTPPAGK